MRQAISSIIGSAMLLFMLASGATATPMTFQDMAHEPSGLPDEMRSHGTRSQLKATILKSGGDDSFGSHSHGSIREH